jgi:ABC-type sugar transport system ATPase subunit
MVVMRDGKRAQLGTPCEGCSRPAREFVGRFLGSPEMNVLWER